MPAWVGAGEFEVGMPRQAISWGLGHAVALFVVVEPLFRQAQPSIRGSRQDLKRCFMAKCRIWGCSPSAARLAANRLRAACLGFRASNRDPHGDLSWLQVDLALRQHGQTGCRRRPDRIDDRQSKFLGQHRRNEGAAKVGAHDDHGVWPRRRCGDR